VRKRAAHNPHTGCNLSVLKIVDIVSRFPLLHAWGIGFDKFRQLPEESRMRAMDYAKYILAYELDDEIDGAYMFMRSVAGRTMYGSANYVKASYLVYMYDFWRTISDKHPVEVPLGCFVVAALIRGQRIRIIEDLKPDFLINCGKQRRKQIEEYLQSCTDFMPWDEKDIYFVRNDDRVGEQENELQSAEAVEQKKEDENG